MKTKLIREALGISQDYAAQANNVCRRTITYWEAKDRTEYREWLYSVYHQLIKGEAQELPLEAQEAEAVRRHLNEVYMQRWFEV